MTLQDVFTFTYPLRVRWAECDAQGIVFNVNYFLYFDVGMTEYLRALGFQGDQVVEFFTVHAGADYCTPARFDDEIEVAIRCVRLGKTSDDPDGGDLSRGRSSDDRLVDLCSC